MADKTNSEKADMRLARGATDFNGRTTQRLYTQKYLHRGELLPMPYLCAYTSNCGAVVFSKRPYVIVIKRYVRQPMRKLIFLEQILPLFHYDASFPLVPAR
ncbi:hypothetical protein TNCV_970661 [Trichonephila clavipes]|nr:hypothetical protein TNCV_970661 [Trichonephila clavipes]